MAGEQLRRDIRTLRDELGNGGTECTCGNVVLVERFTDEMGTVTEPEMPTACPRCGKEPNVIVLNVQVVPSGPATCRGKG